ncbi:hypothetical protein RRG08_035526 [Elysia crispata]|uniref:PiggyBac transposable element-derived protein domain-containing protein n=1 Tax=Elysia crispata TaxID=231223 RepID=A0AAE0Y140_9GAST|nr:hypothetical protein RRG08_035526 [Elysia crispata]
MASRDFIASNDGLDSDVSLLDDDSDYAPSSESDSGDEIAPSPRKKSKVKSSKKPKEGPKTSRCLFAVDADSEDDIPLAQIRDVIRAKEFEEAEDELIRCLDTPMWANIPFEKPNATFGGSEEIVDEVKEPISYFKALVTDEVVEHMAEQTNLYSVQKDGKSMDTSKVEIDLFIGLYLRMGLMQAYAFFELENFKISIGSKTVQEYLSLISHLQGSPPYHEYNSEKSFSWAVNNVFCLRFAADWRG